MTDGLHAFVDEEPGALSGVRAARTVVTLRRVETLTVAPPGLPS
ncbi:hypothetical protein [Streptomyces sp. NPDC088766]